MTAAVARLATELDHPLVDGYAAFCQDLIDTGVLTDRARRDRLRLARRFLDQHPDLTAWMARPLPARLRDLDRVKAWPMLTFAILTGRVNTDLDLLLVKDLGGFGQTAERLHADDYQTGREIAARLGWSRRWTLDVLHECLPLLLARTAVSMRALTIEDLDRFDDELQASVVVSVSSRRAYRARMFGLRQLLFEARVIDTPPTRQRTAASFAERLSVVTPEIARVMLRYLQARAAVLRPSTVSSLCDALTVFGEHLAVTHPEITSLRQLDRRHIEDFLAANASRRWRGRLARDQQVSPTVVHAAVLAVRNFLDDLTAWGWAERPDRQLIFAADVPRLPRALPRALPPTDDARLMAAVAELSDPFARCGLTLLRGAGLRLGELLDLELGSIVDYGPAGSWLKVPLGKLGTERSVPLDPDTLATLDRWAAQRGTQRAHPHPRSGRLTDFMFSERGQRLGPCRIRSGLNRAVADAGLTGADGQPLRVVPHQLRHTYATTLANAGMSLQALMALLGHVTAEMTLRYATLASPTLRAAYDEAIGKARPRLPIIVNNRPVLPSKADWLRGEMLKTRVAHGYCSRHIAAEACPYANICEHCDNYVPAPEFADALHDQLADVHTLRDDAEQRGW
ncbi:MAG TPA: tyrosine-type recombinase/integrase, partial [Microlunatus sp.]|nr:tyrosine-type recombinase/integrase [Microlunatus sp.]